MKIKKGDYVSFTTPVGDKKGYVTSVEGNDCMIKADSFPFSHWCRKLTDVIAKLDKNEQDK